MSPKASFRPKSTAHSIPVRTEHESLKMALKGMKSRTGYSVNMASMKHRSLRRILLPALFSLAFLLLAGVAGAPAEAADKKDEAKPDVDYYDQDSWYGNFFKCFQIWRKDLRYSTQSQKNIEAMGNEAYRNGWRKEGGRYFSAVKLTLIMVVFWLWVATSTWVNNDAQRQADLHRVKWNTTLVTSFPLMFSWRFSSRFSGSGFAFGGRLDYPLSIIYRNSKLLEADRVMTPGHIAFLVKRLVGMDVSKPKPMIYLTGAPIEIQASGRRVSEEAKKGRTIAARNQQPGFNHFKEVVYQAIRYNAVMIRITSGPAQAGISFLIDGVWIPLNTVLDPAGKVRFPLKTLGESFGQ